MTDQTTARQVVHLPVIGARPTLAAAFDVRDLIPLGELIIEPIRYSDDRWDFDGYPFVNQVTRHLDFAKVPARWRNAVKDWVLMRLNPSLARSGASGLRTSEPMAQAAAAERPIGASSAIAYVYGLGVSFKVIEAINASSMGAREWNTFTQQMKRAYPDASAGALAGYARPLLSLWSYRAVLGLPKDLFGGRPFNGRTAEKLFNVPDSFINAGRPDAELVGPLLGLSLWIIDHCAEDILARLEALANIPDRTKAPREDQVAAVHQLLLDWSRTRRPLPAHRVPDRRRPPGPAWSYFVRLAGADNKALNKPLQPARDLFWTLAEERGISSTEDVFDLPINKVPGPDGEEVPWIDALPPTRYDLGLDHWSVTLAYCCAVVITVLTTVRQGELAAIPLNCLRPGTVKVGDIDVPVTFMHGYLVKNRDEPLPTSWIVSADVAKAVEILQQLHELLNLEPQPHPITKKPVLLHPGLGRGRSGAKTGDTLKLSMQWLNWFEASGKHLSERGLMRPLPEFPRWLSHRTLRITGIEAYASQEWGDALAARQAQWSSRTVAEAYVAHLPRSVFIADPDAIDEAAGMARVRNLLGLVMRISEDQDSLAGNGADRVREQLKSAGLLRVKNGALTTKEANRLARETKGKLFIGELTICAPGPGGLCGSDEEADWLLCRPFACRNSGMTLGQRARQELRRRSWAGKGGLMDRAAAKIEQDAPGLREEFENWSDARLRIAILEDFPHSVATAASEDSHVEQP